MAKSTSPKTNGHTVAELKPAAPKKPAAKAPAKPAAKAPVKAAAKAPAKKAPAANPAPAGATKAAAPKPAAKAAAKPAAKSAAKPAAKSAAKPAAKPASKTAVKPPVKAAPKAAAKPAAVAAAPALEKERKAKLVRDSFTMPEQEYAVLGQVKKACLKAGFEIKKSELLRIGVALISELDMATLQKVLDSLPQLKTGRPKNV
ncbi:MAG: hypothetical protein V4723_03755 [Pseudomonadota bacterium]